MTLLLVAALALLLVSTTKWLVLALLSPTSLVAASATADALKFVAIASIASIASIAYSKPTRLSSITAVTTIATVTAIAAITAIAVAALLLASSTTSTPSYTFCPSAVTACLGYMAFLAAVEA
jgi:hypothetical protein